MAGRTYVSGKGASECLPEREADLDEDCNFNLVSVNGAKARLSDTSGISPQEAWQQARSSYFRTLLGRWLPAGLATTRLRYARVSELPTPRWSKLLCESAQLCEKFPDADRMNSERAWSSPIWQVPPNTALTP